MLELAVHIHGGAPVLAGEFGAQHRLIHAVFRRHGGVKAQVVQLAAVPDRIGPVPPLHRGENRAVEARAVFKGQLLDDRAVHHKAQGKGPALCGQIRDSGEVFKGDGLRLAVDGEAAQAGVIRFDKEIVLIHPVPAAGDGPGKLGVIPELHQGIAAGDIAGALVPSSGIVAVAHDAARVAFGAEAALDAACLDAAVEQPADAPGIVAVLDGDSAVGRAVGNDAQVHFARDAARALMLCGDSAAVDAACDHGGHIEARTAETVGGGAAGQVKEGVCIGLHGEGARDAAHIAVPIDAAVVVAAHGLAVGDLLLGLLLVGIVHHHVLLVLAGGERVHGLDGRAGEGVQVLVDIIQVAQQHPGLVADAFPEGRNGIAHIVDTIGDGTLRIEERIRVVDIHGPYRLAHRVKGPFNCLKAVGQLRRGGTHIRRRVVQRPVQGLEAVAQARQQVLGLHDLGQRLGLADHAAHI